MNVLYVAELGSMHKGDVSLACEMIRQVAQANASTVKFQFGWNEEVEAKLGLKPNPVRYLDDNFVKRIASFADKYGIELMASIWSEDGLRQAKMIGMKRYKIAHQMANDEIFVRRILEEGKPTFISNFKHLQSRDWPYDFTRVKCPEKYPAYPDDLRSFWQNTETLQGIGFSDHSHGIGACLLAVSLEAVYIEKHVAIDKSDLTVRDTSFSATPDEFAQLVKYGREIEMWR